MNALKLDNIWPSPEYNIVIRYMMNTHAMQTSIKSDSVNAMSTTEDGTPPTDDRKQ